MSFVLPRGSVKPQAVVWGARVHRGSGVCASIPHGVGARQTRADHAGRCQDGGGQWACATLSGVHTSASFCSEEAAGRVVTGASWV